MGNAGSQVVLKRLAEAFDHRKKFLDIVSGSGGVLVIASPARRVGEHTDNIAIEGRHTSIDEGSATPSALGRLLRAILSECAGNSGHDRREGLAIAGLVEQLLPGVGWDCRRAGSGGRDEYVPCRYR